jgi:CBS domain containing-hemolysin-like protein
MVPLEEYALIDENKTLREAITLLKKKKSMAENGHTTMIICTSKGEIVSELTILDILRAVEPKYRDLSDMRLSRFGYSSDYVVSIARDYGLWAHPLEDLCVKTGSKTLKEVVLPAQRFATIGPKDTLDQATHQMIISNCDELLVREGEQVFGMIRSIDIFNMFCETIESCGL